MKYGIFAGIKLALFFSVKGWLRRLYFDTLKQEFSVNEHHVKNTINVRARNIAEKFPQFFGFIS
jgi:hypothetical protein